MDPDQTARMRRLVWIYAGRKRITLVLSWSGSHQFAVRNLKKKQSLQIHSGIMFCKSI
jgi:hypothetical protein